MIGFALFGNSHATVSSSTIIGASDVGISQNSGTLTLSITDSSILDNDAGGIDLEGDSAAVTITSSTLANDDGNGLYDGDTDGTVTVRNSTVADNGGAGLESVAPMTVTGSTIVGNEVIGLRSDYGPLTIGSDVIADNQIGDCRAMSTVDLGFNIDSLTSAGSSSPCRLTSPTSVAASTTIADSLEPLGSNGGPTETIALKPDSPAIGLVTGLLTDGSPICGTPDQRGVTRHATTCDSGASEAGAPKQANVSLAVGASGGTTVGGTTTLAATVLGSGGTTPTGTISFTAGGVPFGTACGNVALHGSGSTATATCQAKLPVGSYQLRGSYGGDATYQAGSDTISAYPINKATTSTTAHAVKKAKHGKKVKISVTTKHSGGTGHPTGHVVIYDNGKKIHTVTEKSTGKITTTVKIAKGRNYIQAVYSGDKVFTGSSGNRVVAGT
jgi:hypothetical protein